MASNLLKPCEIMCCGLIKSKAWRWQHHASGLRFLSWNWGFNQAGGSRFDRVKAPAKTLTVKTKFTFQYDHDPKRPSISTKVWLQLSKVKVLERPSQSPALNRIQNLYLLFISTITSKVQDIFSYLLIFKTWLFTPQRWLNSVSLFT